MSEEKLSNSLTKTEKILIYCLMQFPISEETQESIFLTICNDEKKMWEMIRYLKENLNATEQMIIAEHWRIMGIKT